METIKSELKEIRKEVKDQFQKEIKDERAFDYLISSLYYFKTMEFETSLYEIGRSITDDANDGGIDIVWYDDENSKVIVGQSKFSPSVQPNNVIEELNKMSNTIQNFKKHQTGQYNGKLKTELQNALDRLDDGYEDNIEYNLFTISKLDKNTINNKIENTDSLYSKDMVNIYSLEDITNQLKEMNIKNNTVSEFKVSIDEAKNYLHYETSKNSGIMVNLSSDSLVEMYNKFKDDGLLDLNIRKYIRNKIVDDGIKRTLDNERDEFWYLNNGLIIACSDYTVDGDKIKLYDFSIVNGGQTTNRIGEYKGSNSESFYIPCKIVKSKVTNPEFYSKIAEATNSQKPILPRDLKANSPEMKSLKRWLAQNDICLEIKRGDKKTSSAYSVKNDELGQLMESFMYQKPGLARSGKKKIFENPGIYNKLFKQSYEKDINKKNFIIDLIKIKKEFDIIDTDLKNGEGNLSDDEKTILLNAKFIIIALFGLIYRVTNGDISFSELQSDKEILETQEFEYGQFYSNNHDDDYHKKLKDLVIEIVRLLEDIYNKAAQNGSVTSVSNLFKKDNTYKDEIIRSCINYWESYSGKGNFEIFKTLFKREVQK